jgi:hypothetical protein
LEKCSKQERIGFALKKEILHEHRVLFVGKLGGRRGERVHQQVGGHLAGDSDLSGL